MTDPNRTEAAVAVADREQAALGQGDQTRNPPRRKARLLKRSLLVLLVGTVGWAAYFSLRYPGLTRGLYRDFRYSTVHENKGLYFCIAYWMHFIQKMSFNTDTRVWNFDQTPETNLDNFEKGRLAFHRGDFTAAASLISEDMKRKGESEDKLFWLALTYMRLGETQNCLRATRELIPHEAHDASGRLVCTLPLTVFHAKGEYSREAARLWQKLLDHYDHSNYLYRWLLNLSYMTINGFPNEVPPEYRIEGNFRETFYGSKRDAMQSKYDYLSFEERALDLGLNTFNTGRGVAVEDFTHDGFMDIVTCSTFEGMHFFKNQHGSAFTDQTKSSGLEGIKQCFSVIPVDYDNDGWPDIFISRPFSHYTLMRNNHNGTFTDVTVEVGLWDPKDNGKVASTWIAAWADVNNDGKLDLFLAQWGFEIPWTSGIMNIPRMDSALLINENGHFRNRTKEYGLTSFVRDYYYIGAAFGDYNGDGLPDLLLVSPLRKSTLLLRNVDGKRFEDSGLVRREGSGFTGAFVDVNHDGRMDIFIGGFGDAKTNTEQVVFGEQTNELRDGHSALLIQQPDGSFKEDNLAFDMPVSTMGASWGDLTNDGCYDFYLGTGDPEPWYLLPHMMYMGKPQGTGCSLEFDNVSMLQGFGNLQKGHGIVFFDFNNDGKQDVYSALGGMWPGDGWTSQLFVNRSRTSNSWIKIRLRGRQTNYFGMGARIRIAAENARGEEIIRYYSMDNKTGFGGGPLLAHVGLSNATKIKNIEVFWPTSHCTASYQGRLQELNTLDEAKCFSGDSLGRSIEQSAR